MDSKICTGCHKGKSLTEFGPVKGRVGPRCRSCVSAAAREYRKKPTWRSSHIVKGGYSDSYEAKRVRDIKRFWSFVQKSDGCWLWTGPPSQDGYGRFQPRALGRRLRVNRAAWWVVNGSEPPTGLLVCHKCDNPPCVNPDHLFLGTYLDNNSDCSRKGRATVDSKVHKGSENGRAKLDDEQVREIRRRFASQAVTQTTLAREYGVSAQVIHAIVTGKRWTHVQ